MKHFFTKQYASSHEGHVAIFFLVMLLGFATGYAVGQAYHFEFQTENSVDSQGVGIAVKKRVMVTNSTISPTTTQPIVAP